MGQFSYLKNMKSWYENFQINIFWIFEISYHDLKSSHQIICLNTNFISRFQMMRWNYIFKCLLGKNLKFYEKSCKRIPKIGHKLVWSNLMTKIILEDKLRKTINFES